MRELLNEKQWRHYLALEAQERGSVAQVAQEASVSQNTVRRGLRELEAGEHYTPGDRQREVGGGRKQAVEKAYGVYDLVHNCGFVNVGIDHDTAEFAVESIRRCWQQQGKALYPDKKALLING